MAKAQINSSSNISLLNIKSNYILKQIFNNLQKKILLNLIRYNKTLQKRLNKDINDYKIEYSKIELEIYPIENKNCTFINVSKKNMIYYHIYFNNDKIEIKRNNITKCDKVNKIKIIIDYEIKSLYKLFRHCKFIKKINFKKFNNKDINNMSFMFDGCKSLEELNLSNFNTDNVTSMSFMFFGCSSLKELNLSNFNTNSVINMSYMFYGCELLKTLNLSNFNTNNVKDMSHMFDGCSSLIELNISNFNTNNVIDMSYMFFECSSLKDLDLSNCDINKVYDKSNMLVGCPLLKKLNINNCNNENNVDYLEIKQNNDKNKFSCIFF